MTSLNLTFPAAPSVTLTGGDELALTFPAPQTVVLAAVGLQGPAGGSSARYTHTQSATSATWTVNHNLGFRPQVEVLSPGGVQVEAAVQHMSDNQTVITFTTAQTGQAIFN